MLITKKKSTKALSVLWRLNPLHNLMQESVCLSCFNIVFLVNLLEFIFYYIYHSSR